MNDTVWKLDFITGAKERQPREDGQQLGKLLSNNNQQDHKLTITQQVRQPNPSTLDHTPERQLHLRSTSSPKHQSKRISYDIKIHQQKSITRSANAIDQTLSHISPHTKQPSIEEHGTSTTSHNNTSHNPGWTSGHFKQPVILHSNDQPKQHQLSPSRQKKVAWRESLNRERSIHSAPCRQFDRHTTSLLQTSHSDSNCHYSLHSQPWNITLYNRRNRASGQTHGSLSSVPEEMGKIESRNIFTDKDNDHTRIHGDISTKKFQSGFNIIHDGKSQPVVLNGNYKNGHNDKQSNSTKEKAKTKKLLTSRSPRTGIDHHQAIMYAQIKDTSFYENDFRHRSMSESQAQLRKKVLERRLRMSGALDGNEDAPHRVTWADNLGSSLTCDSRRRSFSQGSTGLPNKPILKKLPHNETDSSEVNHQSVLPVDTRYL